MLKNSINLIMTITLITSLALGQSAKSDESLSQEQRDEAAKVIGRLWLSIRPHLTKEEHKVVSNLMSEGLERHHQILKKESQKQAEKE